MKSILEVINQLPASLLKMASFTQSGDLCVRKIVTVEFRQYRPEGENFDVAIDNGWSDSNISHVVGMSAEQAAACVESHTGEDPIPEFYQ